jgi:DNA-binding response OmpR family regulator
MGELREGDTAERGGGVNTRLREPIATPRLVGGVVRSVPAPGTELLRLGDISLNVQLQTVSLGGVDSRLTAMQTRLLETFMRYPGQVLSRRFLMKEVWDTDFVGDTRTLEVHIYWLRQAIEEKPSHPVRLVTVRGVGYCLDVPPTRPARRR